MKIGLIAMSGVRVHSPELAALGVTMPGFVRRGEVIASLPTLGLLTVAGLTPAGHELEYIELPGPVTESGLPDFDLVAISSLSARIREAYAVADLYRQRGTRVVMGGLHVSAIPGEALHHADAVVTGGAEGAWPRVVADAANGCLQRLYPGATDGVFQPSLYARPRYDLLAGRAYNRVTVQTSRGCPRACEFCGASLRITQRFNQKPVPLVMDEIQEARRWFREPFLELADDNSFLNRDWSREFLQALAAEELHWFAETDASVGQDPELARQLAEAGCRQVLIGFESPNDVDLERLDPADWKRRQAPRIRRTIDTLQSAGVSVNGCFLLGLDTHTPDIFPALLDFVRGSGLAEVQFTVQTPFPGTPLYQRLAREGRLLKPDGWERCTLFDVNYQPKRMSVGELEHGIRWLMAETYTGKAVRERLRGFVAQRRGVQLGR